MTSPDRITLDAYSDPNLAITNPNGSYNRFTNYLKQPILGAKSIQLVSANFVNSVLQLNDASQLAFYYYTSTSAANIRQAGNLRCIRLLPSSYVAGGGISAYVRNKYFNSVVELVSALNLAANSGGDNTTYNPLWTAGQVSFTYDTTTRKVSITGLGSAYIVPAAADDPIVQSAMVSSPLTMLGYGGVVSQPYKVGTTMNARLGFGMSVNSRGIYWGASSQYGCASSTGVPLLGVPIEAESSPILLGAQNLNVYLSCAQNSGFDSLGLRRNLICSVPVSVAPLNINSFTPTGLFDGALTIGSDVNDITIELLDETGVPFFQPANYNSQFSFAIQY